MKLQAALFFFSVSEVFSRSVQERNRDGLISAVPGYAMNFYSSRWEPLCGTITTMISVLDWGTDCINAIAQYTNDTRSTLSYYDSAGVRLIGAGVGLGKPVCLCFAMSTAAGVAYDICWSFNGIGQYWVASNATIGSYRPGAAKSLPQCGGADVGALQREWTRTAIMPQATGPVETVNQGPTMVDNTVTQTLTQTLTPTLVNLTILSSAVVTDSNGQMVTENRSYTTTAAVINFQPAPDVGLTTSNKIALGIGLGLGIPSLFVSIGAWCYSDFRKKAKKANRVSYTEY